MYTTVPSDSRYVVDSVANIGCDRVLERGWIFGVEILVRALALDLVQLFGVDLSLNGVSQE